MKRLVCSILFSFLVISVSGSFPFGDLLTNNDALGTRETGSYRLSGDAIPISYNIFLNARSHENDFDFDGEVEIMFRAEKDAAEVVLHARQLKILAVDFIDLPSFNNASYMCAFRLDPVTDFLTMWSSHNEKFLMKAGSQYKLIIKYKGTLRTDNAGFYRSAYKNAKNENVNLATTQFQTTDARHAFPCFDEPGYKATFDIAIKHNINFKAISNMPVTEVIESGATQTTKFETTPLMSTYLVAFIISDFVSTESILDNKPHRVFSREDAKSDQSFALATSKLALKSLQDYLGVSYSLPKMDNVAIPDFAAGAMENWGLVTYREEYLLYNKEKSTTNTELNIAIMIAHEFAHQWFGNLVTPKWWQHLWMNEGFASLYEYLTVDDIYKDWDVMQIFTVSHYQRALLSDGQKSPRAMSHYVEDPISIANIFDSVSYAKSACVLRMFQHALTDASFKKALNGYLTKNSFGVVEQNDLFEYLTTAALESNAFGSVSYSAKGFFESWTDRGGYPVLTVTRDYSSGDFTIKQEMFDGTNSVTAIRVWVVPFNYVYGNNPNFTNTRADGWILMTPTVTVQRKSDDSHSKNDWLLLNKQQTGYYRVNYDRENWNLLTKALIKDHTKIHPHNRAQLIDDAVRLTFSGRLTPDIPFALIEYLKTEEDYAPWAAANNAFAALNSYMIGDKDYNLFQYYIGQLVSEFYKKVGTVEGPNDSMHRKLTRNIAINWACRADVEKCLDEMNKQLNQVIDSKAEIKPNLKTSVYCNGLVKGGEKEFHFIFREILDSDDQAKRRQLMPTLGCSQNATLLMAFVETSITYGVEINYREQERLNVLSAIVDKNQVGLMVAIRFLKDNHEQYAQLGSDFTKTDTLLSAIRNIASRVYSTDLSTELNGLLDSALAKGSITSADVTSIRSTVVTNIALNERNKLVYFSWLKKYKNSAGSLVLSSAAVVVTVMLSLRSLF